MNRFIEKITPRNALVRGVVMAVVTALLAILILVALFGYDVRAQYANRMMTYDEAIATSTHALVADYGVVLGASVDSKTGGPSVALKDRLDTAIDLLKNRALMGVIITGDDGSWKSDEMKAMRDYLHAQHVPDEIISEVGGDYRTFDSCRDLKLKNFNHVALITQRFHLPRALYLCNELGVDSVGIIADRRWYLAGAWYWLRDWLASPFAYLDVRGVTLIKKGPGFLF